MQNRLILLIDDDVDDHEIFNVALLNADDSVKCIYAKDGINALELLKNNELVIPDFIFIDMNMPKMSGSECLVEIKKIERLKDIPVYMYSTFVDPNKILVNKQLGAEDFITKPCDINTLTNLLIKLLVKNPLVLIALFVLMMCIPIQNFGQSLSPDSIPKVDALKMLSVEQLINLVVTSVSKTPENISEVASAIQVITGDEINRSNVIRLPEALRLATNMQVAQSGSHDWSITSRGFSGLPVSNSSLANKLLVLIDGRSTYTPLFGGVFWDVQNVMMEDLNRIEVISGPGGTIWGANAVNGVVNIISKSAEETQGVYASAEAGTFLEDKFAVRYGSRIDSTFFFRVYGQRFDYGNTEFEGGKDARDSWYMNQGGFRADYNASSRDKFTFQGDLYGGEEDDTASTIVDGQNVILKWTHEINDKSSLSVKYFYDRTFRNIQIQGFQDKMITNDFDFQHNFEIGEKYKMVWGADYRIAQNQINSVLDDFKPPSKQLTLFSAFIQGQIALIPSHLELTVGTKLLYNNYSAYDFQPTIRLAYTYNNKNTVWASVSQAVRTPSRYEVDNASLILGSYGDFHSETVNAYELGYHARPFEKFSFSLDKFLSGPCDLLSRSSSDAKRCFFSF